MNALRSLSLKHISVGLAIVGGFLFLYGLIYDVHSAGGLSWDDPPELQMQFESEIKVANRIFVAAWIAIIAGMFAAATHVVRYILGCRPISLSADPTLLSSQAGEQAGDGNADERV